MAVLVDTNIWIHHLRRKNRLLIDLLEAGEVQIHPMITAELCLGQIKAKNQMLDFLSFLPLATVLSQEELLHLISIKKLAGTGLGYVDTHLVGSALLEDFKIWTADKALKRESERLGCCFDGNGD